MSIQLVFPVAVPVDEVRRKKTLGEAIRLCAELADYELDKQLAHALGVDTAQFSRWHSGAEGISWAKFSKLMDHCGNDAPLLWMLHARGYDLHSVRKLETETERENRQLREEVSALRRVLGR